ncbi:uncharacterized protein LOC124154284 [Ischnura elegans]|uniref:uncharacterized protein LOC124154284 n=1 Tax=Ischnura elegans TaxID=197161 RepID=UPI001ED8BE05|nr:uncharacterized protein LOC124154284 [Ischnura elegans]
MRCCKAGVIPMGTTMIVAVLLLASVMSVLSKPTIYKRNNNDKLEPVLVPVSSTVIPLPVYKVAYGLGVGGADKLSKPSGPTKLITVNKKKAQIKSDWIEGSTDGRRGRSIVKKL